MFFYMKYSDLIIAGVPKSFDVFYTPDYLQPIYEGMETAGILYDLYLADCDEDRGEKAVMLFKYGESATGVYVVHTPHLQTVSVHLSKWAGEADVYLYAAFVNAVLSKHKRARLYDKYQPLERLTEEMVSQMIRERKAYLRRELTTKEGFTMDGLNAGFTLKVAHLRPAPSLDMQVLELQKSFIRMQWEDE